MRSHFHILTCSPVLSPVHVSHCCLCLLYFFLFHHMFSTLTCPVISYSCGKPPERHMFLHSPWATVQLEQPLIQKSLSPHFYLLLNSFTTPVVRVQPCISDSVLFRCISDASPKLFCILRHIAYRTPHVMQLHIAPCIRASTHATSACLFVCLFTFVTSARVACFVCLFPLPDWFC